MNVHYLQHVPFEGIGSMESFFKEKGYPVTCTKLYDGDPLPQPDAFDLLIVMGGPMGIYDEDEYPWLKAEKQFIAQVISEKKKVLGICLGAQLIADVLGAKVYKNRHREIGWFAIDGCPELENTLLADVFTQKPNVFHWHGDTFDIPAGAVAVAKSRACANQGFIKDNHVIAFQFHLETTFQSARALIDNCSDELDGSAYVQSESEILSDPQRFLAINALMHTVLEKMASCL
ncbi:MAG: type 1 glutamine amidotransferase [Proteobacteria bacterium]|nr:type 1 glutamine amidotransferase [Pseudomonadota bacterium]MBU1389899.1 type 1 glutamine amidotransferase [Pseudomonadota bacterium]MBU1543908.1 type 1 glutamine amidotransferase [Pseudomonadota bacterium]MBU2429411.1 type 1 glutamine amidotransferase [Pseudomonadota bacterium]MBU2482186.1 type 1 glutamine amidotransferase [Pseudomonadota bacterium]